MRSMGQPSVLSVLTTPCLTCARLAGVSVLFVFKKLRVLRVFPRQGLSGNETGEGGARPFPSPGWSVEAGGYSLSNHFQS